MIFSRRVPRQDLCRSVRALAIFAGRERRVRLRSGRFDWTVQVRYPPPVTESRVRRRAQEKATRMTLEFPQKSVAEAKQRSAPILVLDLNSGLGLKGSKRTSRRAFRGRAPQGEPEVGGIRNGKTAPEHRQYFDHSVLGSWPDATARHFTHAGSLGGTCWNSSHC